MIYLDTHVVAWLFAKKIELISSNALSLIENESDILISPVVILELQYLYEIGRINIASKSVFDYLHTRLALQVCRRSFSSF